MYAVPFVVSASKERGPLHLWICDVSPERVHRTLCFYLSSENEFFDLLADGTMYLLHKYLHISVYKTKLLLCMCPCMDDCICMLSACICSDAYECLCMAPCLCVFWFPTMYLGFPRCIWASHCYFGSPLPTMYWASHHVFGRPTMYLGSSPRNLDPHHVFGFNDWAPLTSRVELRDVAMCVNGPVRLRATSWWEVKRKYCQVSGIKYQVFKGPT